jgi:hypothetical protein
MISWNRATKKQAELAMKACPGAAGFEPELCEGNIKLEITPFESFSQINRYKKFLATIKNLRIIEENWSEDEGFNILVSVQVPLALGRLLMDMPEVARVQVKSKNFWGDDRKHGLKKMVVVMKAPATAPEPALV